MVDAVKDLRIEVVAAVDALDGGGVELADGSRAEPDAIISATGYRRGLEPLVGHLGVLDERGLPRVHAGHAAAPGLRFIGYLPRPAQIRRLGREARRAAGAVARERRSRPAASGHAEPALWSRKPPSTGRVTPVMCGAGQGRDRALLAP